MGKESLLKFEGELAEEAGSTLPISWQGEVRGYALRTVTGIKPVFVSAGHNISHKEALSIVKSFTGKYRIIDPMRRADMAARKMAREASEEDKISFLYTLS
jgi:deoxyribonuclease V